MLRIYYLQSAIFNFPAKSTWWMQSRCLEIVNGKSQMKAIFESRMKKLLQLAALLFPFVLSAQQVPFQVEIEPVNAAAVPAVHSFAFAQHGSKWLIVGGRTNGLHGFSTNDNFDVMYANEHIVVVDTTTWNYYASSILSLPMNLKDPLRSTNMQYTVIGDYLYIAGGFGWDSTLNRYDTYSSLTAIRIDSMINAVVNNQPIAPHIRQITHPELQVTGGEMMTIGDTSYLIFGHYFRGRYAETPSPVFTQVYSEEVKKFVIDDDGVNLNITYYGSITDTNNFHRRDLNVGPTMDLAGNASWAAYSGVFRKESDLPYLEPIQYNTNGTYVVDSSFDQRMNNYTCPLLPVFDSVQGTMYTVFFGGCSLYDYDPSNGNMTYDSLVPFVHDVSVMVHEANGAWAQVPLALQLPDWLGSNMKFVPLDTAPMYSNEVIRLRDVQSRMLVGYLYGGIQAQGPNDQPSTANDTIFRVYLTPDVNLLNIAGPATSSAIVFPNPASDDLFVKVTEQGTTVIEMRNSLGQLVYTAAQSGAGTLSIPVKKLAAGTYTVTLKGQTTSVIPVTISH
jgi:hypothetical protein